MRIKARDSGCAPPGPQKQAAATGVGARHGRKCEQAAKPLTQTSNHTPPTLASRTLVAVFSSEGCVVGFELFDRRNDARAFLRAGGAA